MEDNTIENPWNLKLKTFDISECAANSKVLQKRSFIDRFYFIKSIPHLFSRKNDLVLCQICNILICKSSFLRHAKIYHNNGEDDNSYFQFKEIQNVFPESNVNNKIPKKTNKMPSRQRFQNSIKEKNSKVTENRNLKLTKKIEKPTECDYKDVRNTNDFVPKSTLNAANPLRIKIQLQPKRENEQLRNGNVFEYINNYYNDITNNNQSQNVPINGNIGFRHENFESIDTSRRKESREASNSNRVIRVEKYRPTRQNGSDRLSHLSTNSQPRGTAIVQPHRLRHSNQTSSSLPNRNRMVTPPLSQQPKVFQSFRREVNSGGTVKKKYVEVKSLREAFMPASSNQSLNISDNNFDHHQRSFQQILIDNGMFSQEDIQRCQKPSPILDLGHTNKGNKSSEIPGSNSTVRIVQGIGVTHRPITDNYPRFLNHRVARPYSLDRACDIMTNSDSLLAPKAVQSNVRNYTTDFYQTMDLSDDEFFLDSTVTNNLDSRTITQIPDTVDTDVHYLPPPEETITSLSWEL